MKNLKEMTNEQLAIAYANGDNKAFDLLLTRTQGKLYQYILFVVRDRAMADDVFQDTFVKAITKIRNGNYQPNGKFNAWLIRIAHNVVMDMYRDLRFEKIVEPTVDNDLSNLSGNDFLDGNIENQYITEQNFRDARALMEALPASQREIVYMRFYQQMSFKEIAEATGISINTCLGRMRYAVHNMRRMANQYKLAM
ncbi:MAG: sigma-70 family RNA polymerase sigma factor [Prevotellaceae bacterium]|nr:sigma-70 family RNA polymerase sigma factor [Prevotellaceae bacterium]